MGATPGSRFTVEDLLESAAAAGMPATPRLITDWVTKGLLDRPQIRGLGRGKGTIATWPESQRQLFLALLDQRRRGVRRTATLCNLPVTVWLDSEGQDPQPIPLRQVRRCLATWSAAYRTGPVAAARRTAQLLIEQHGAPHITRRARQDLVDAVIRATGGAPLDHTALHNAAHEAFRAGPLAHIWVRTIEARVTAIKQLDAFDDASFETACLIVNQAAAIYVDRELTTATKGGARVARAHELLNELSGSACVGLLTSLGLLELERTRASTTEPTSDKSPRRRANAPGPAPGKDTSECDPSVPSPPRAASSPLTGTG